MSFNNRKDIRENLSSILVEIEEVNKKWHINEDGTPKPRDEEFSDRCFLLMMSEIMESFEGYRKDNPPDSHLPQYPSVWVEITDLFIRSLDYIVFSNDLTILSKLNNLLDHTPISAGTDINFYTQMVNTICTCFNQPSNVVVVTDLCINFCDQNQIPLMEVYRAKTDYNKNRADHKIENRSKKNGKKF